MVYGCKRPVMKMANGGYLVGWGWAVVGCRFYGITPRAECEGYQYSTFYLELGGYVVIGLN